MTAWHDYLMANKRPPEWPYPVRYDQEQEIEADVLIIGGGIAGCWAAISAARKGVKVAIIEKGVTIRSGAGGPGCDHWCDCAANPLSITVDSVPAGSAATLGITPETGFMP